ncbi:hypothetical protein FDUTEX481_00717 [Tolypothrix sp. PCC 7601]|nr:hypothetical protein FDUTEX481_00717 [Tolypothrix sp. PCC 7601]
MSIHKLILLGKTTTKFFSLKYLPRLTNTKLIKKSFGSNYLNAL